MDSAVALLDRIRRFCGPTEGGDLKRILVIAIAGAGCIGKSTLAARMRGWLGDSQCHIVSLDGYMLPRRAAHGLTGYDPRRFELGKARTQLYGLVRHGKGFRLCQYDRRTHERESPELIEVKPTIILEGGLALRPELYDVAQVHVFLDAGRETQFVLRARREKEEFAYSTRQITERFALYYRDYVRYLLPQRERADIIARVNNDYSLTFLDSSVRRAPP